MALEFSRNLSLIITFSLKDSSFTVSPGGGAMPRTETESSNYC